MTDAITEAIEKLDRQSAYEEFINGENLMDSPDRHQAFMAGVEWQAARVMQQRDESKDAERWQWFRKMLAMPDSDKKERLMTTFGNYFSDESDSDPTEKEINAAIDAAIAQEKTS